MSSKLTVVVIIHHWSIFRVGVFTLAGAGEVGRSTQYRWTQNVLVLLHLLLDSQSKVQLALQAMDAGTFRGGYWLTDNMALYGHKEGSQAEYQYWVSRRGGLVRHMREPGNGRHNFSCLFG